MHHNDPVNDSHIFIALFMKDAIFLELIIPKSELIPVSFVKAQYRFVCDNIVFNIVRVYELFLIR